MNKYMRKLAIITLIALGFAAQAAELVSPMSVKVNGKCVDVMQTETPQDYYFNHVDAHAYFASFFDAENEVEIEVSGPFVSGKDVRILPLSRGIVPEKVSDSTISFRAKPPFTLVVEPTGRHRALVLAATLPEKDAPRADDPNVVYFGPGKHHRDETIYLKSNETLYLAAGACVEGTIVAQGTNITVCGRGILSGNPWARYKGPEGKIGRNAEYSGLAQIIGSDITIRDVTFLGSYGWTLVLQDCARVTIDNVKILGGRVINDDAIDICSSRDILIRNCFIRAQDDCIAPKWWCENLLVEDCILWTDFATICRVGYECDKSSGHLFKNIVLRNIDVLHQSLSDRSFKDYWSNPAIFIQPSCDHLMTDIVFDNFRFDTPVAKDKFLIARTFIPKGTWSVNSPGRLKGLTVRNISFPASTPEGAMGVWLESYDPEHGIEDVSFENVRPCGPIHTVGEVRNFRIVK